MVAAKSVAIVTGGAKGIGAAIARHLAEHGAHVAAVDADAEALRGVELKTAAGGTVEGFSGNILDKGFLTSMVDRLTKQHGGLHILVNNAGIIRDGFLSKLSEDDWDTVMAVNLKGPFLCCQAVVPTMKEAGGGKIVNIVSRAWLGNVGQANYSASKGGLVSLTRTLAMELARWNINVNAVAPGLIDTPMTRGLKPEVKERLIATQPLRRMGTTQEIASTVGFLCGEGAGFITGQVIHVDGGKSCGLLAL
jgi:3-oxoacyl-[acyl-carrier protein] reductase